MRIYLRLLSALLAAALLALGVVVAVEVVLAALNKPSWVLPYSSLASTMRENTWNSGYARTTAGVLCLIGLVLLISALRRGKPAEFSLTPLNEGVTSAVQRRGLQGALRDAATRVDGIGAADVTLKRRKARVTAESTLNDPGDIPQQVEREVAATLEEISLERPLKVSVTTNGKS